MMNTKDGEFFGVCDFCGAEASVGHNVFSEALQFMRKNLQYKSVRLSNNIIKDACVSCQMQMTKGE